MAFGTTAISVSAIRLKVRTAKRLWWASQGWIAEKAVGELAKLKEAIRAFKL